MQGFPDTEAPGVSVFYKDDAGSMYHTYSAYSRGIDILNGAYNYIDLLPKGRDEADGPQTWVRHHDDTAPELLLITRDARESVLAGFALIPCGAIWGFHLAP